MRKLIIIASIALSASALPAAENIVIDRNGNVLNTKTTKYGTGKLMVNGVAVVGGSGTGTGNVSGPGTSVNNRVALFSGTTGTVIADSGLTLSGINTGDQTITLTGDVTGTGTGTFAATLANTTVTPGVYTAANITIDAKGRITLAANGGASFVTGPTSSVNNRVAIFSDTTGKILADSGVILGTAASAASTAFATAAQGVKADTAVQTISLTMPAVLFSTPNAFGIAAGGIATGGPTLILQPPNTVLAGPASGSTNATPTMRLMVAADIPALPESKITNLATSLALKAPVATTQIAAEGTFADNAGSTGTPTAWTAASSSMTEAAALTATRYSTLRPASEFPSGTIATYTDDKTLLNFGRQFRPSGATDTLNGLNAAAWGADWFASVAAGGRGGRADTQRFKTNATSNGWTAIDTNQSIVEVFDPDTGNAVTFTAPDAGTNPVNLPGNSTAMRPSVAGAGQAAIGGDVEGNFIYGDVGGGSSAPTGPKIMTAGATIPWIISSGMGNQPQYSDITLGSAANLLAPTADTGGAVNPTMAGVNGVIRVRQDATGGRTILTPPGSYSSASAGGGGTVTLTSTANATDALFWSYDGSNFYWRKEVNYTTSTIPAPQVLEWRLNEATGTATTAVVGPNGTLSSSTSTWLTTATTPRTELTGNSAGAFSSLVTSNATITSAGALSYSSSVATVHLWIWDDAFPTSAARRYYLTPPTGVTTNGSWRISTLGDGINPGTIDFTLWGGNNTALVASLPVSAVSTSTWHHLEVTFDNTTVAGAITVKLDNVAQTPTITGTRSNNSGGPIANNILVIGGSASGANTTAFDHISIYNGTNTSAQQTAIHGAGAK